MKMRFILNSILSAKQKHWTIYLSNLSTIKRQITKICVVGSGPSGFYTAQHLLKKNPDVQVDIIEKLPVPFGLIRYGVAPDHPEIKNVIDGFTKTATEERCSFYGNVNVGKDILVDDLLKAYNAVVLAYGASEDRKLGIPGEELHNVIPARKFVGWFNGVPEHAREPIDLDTDVAAVIGQGNVALDVARMLLRDPEMLKSTDVSEHALKVFQRSKINKVLLIGRRGPLQVAFTIKEFREMTKLAKCSLNMCATDFEGIIDLIPTIHRSKKRLIELMVSSLESCGKVSNAEKQFELKFYRSPKSLLSDGNNNVSKIVLDINKSSNSLDTGNVTATGEEEVIECGLVIKSVGYKSTSIDTSVPFDDTKSIVSNKLGKASCNVALYCSGWLKTGPTGVIPSTMNSSYETAEKLLYDLEKGDIPKEEHAGSSEILPLLKQKGVLVTTFDHWKRIDAEEQRRGVAVGKPREKICDVKEMLQIASLA